MKFFQRRLLHLATAGIVGVFAMLMSSQWTQAQEGTPCSPKILERLRSTSDKKAVTLNCTLRLDPDDVIERLIIFEGNAASGNVLDCNGAHIAGPGSKNANAILIRSKKRSKNIWEQPVGVTIKNCRVSGRIRIYGLNENANGGPMKEVSRRPDATQIAQAVAPTRVSLQNLDIDSTAIAVYFGPGVTDSELVDSRLTGRGAAMAIYLDAESARNRLVGNRIDVQTRGREVIAIDGSAGNRITDNRFINPINGGIFVYRNCGEGGVIRHQMPHDNVISKNRFEYVGKKKAPAIALNTRNGWRLYCFRDDHHPFGSSLNGKDFAEKNTITDNIMTGGGSKFEIAGGEGNTVSGNRAVE